VTLQAYHPSDRRDQDFPRRLTAGKVGATADRRSRFAAYLRKVEGGYAIKRDPYFRDQFRRILETGEHPKLGVDMWQVLERIGCPTLVIRGARSDTFAAETVAKVRAANTRFRIVEVESGHNVAVENQAGFLAEVRPFLQRVEPQHEQDA
jgi:pimeloyl-ACP methyl ester carboxylesterase